ncbi:MAG: FliM/FliN family flagellar motor switch protein, partial [Acidobacteria bacterium]|nr:FliM/FliN family flagellar motor switch protein [Acidobacteriota bacterium]
PVHVNIVLGQKMVRIAELLDFAPGSILDLKRPAGESLLIFLEDTLFGKGEVTVKEDSFTIRITGINDPRNL